MERETAKKRPLATFAEGCDTDALCRAVKRLHTCSSGSLQAQTSSEDWDEDESLLEESQETTSPPIADAAQGPVLPISSKSTDFQPSLCEKSELQTPKVAHCGASWLSTRLKISTALPPEDFIPKANHEVVAAPLDYALGNIQQRLRRVNVASEDAAEGNFLDVEQPPTPGKKEVKSPPTSKAYKLGTKDGSASQNAYDLLYEEANSLLKNLHFERLQRHGEKDGMRLL